VALNPNSGRERLGPRAKSKNVSLGEPDDILWQKLLGTYRKELVAQEINN
jgi:hypothetical protein